MLTNKAIGSKTASIPEGSWDVSTAVFESSFSVSAQDGNPNGLFFKTDGDLLFVVGDSNNSVFAYTLSTPWDISTASFLTSFSVSARSSAPAGISFSNTGTVMIIMDAGADKLVQYSLSSAWNIGTASFVTEVSVATQDAGPQDVYVKPDGTKLYTIGTVNDRIYEYDLSIPWDISTLSFLQSFSISSTGEGTPTALFFKPDGTKMFFAGQGLDRIQEYSLSTAWSVTSASYIHFFYAFSQESIPRGLSFSNDGNRMFITGIGNDSIISYTLS